MVEVKYNNAVIASLEAGQTATLQCNGKKMVDDVIITAPEVVDNPLPIEVETEIQMNTLLLLEETEVGAVYKYTGETTARYENGALYVVEEEVNLIYFTISGASYEAEEGMTWEQWLDTPYNTQGFTRNLLGGVDTVQISGNSVGGYALSYYSDVVPVTDVIVPNREYSSIYKTHSGGAG